MPRDINDTILKIHQTAISEDDELTRRYKQPEDRLIRISELHAALLIALWLREQSISNGSQRLTKREVHIAG